MDRASACRGAEGMISDCEEVDCGSYWTQCHQTWWVGRLSLWKKTALSEKIHVEPYPSLLAWILVRVGFSPQPPFSLNISLARTYLENSPGWGSLYKKFARKGLGVKNAWGDDFSFLKRPLAIANLVKGGPSPCSPLNTPPPSSIYAQSE